MQKVIHQDSANGHVTMDYSDNHVRASVLARNIAEMTGRAFDSDYFNKLINATCQHLKLAFGCIYHISDELGDQWSIIADSVDSDRCSGIPTSLESLIRSESTGSRLPTIIDLNSINDDALLDCFQDLSHIISFNLYGASNINGGIIVVGCNNVSLDLSLIIDVIETQLPMAEVVLDNLKNINQLNRYKDNYDKLVSSSPDAIWEADLSGCILDIRGSCKSIYGHDAEFMIGKNYADFMTEISARHYFENLSILSHGEAVYNVLSNHVTRGYEHVVVSYNIIPKYDQNNNVTGILGATRDISTSIKALKTVKNNNELFSSILSRLPVIFFRLDNNGSFIEIRGNGLKRMGVEDMDWVDKPGYGLFIGMDAEIDSALDGNTVFFENKGTCDGKPWWFYTSMFFDGWTGRGAVGFSVDITEQKYVEDQLVLLLNSNRKLSQQLVEVQEEERRTLARELHDELGQSITAVKSLATVISASTGTQYTEIRSLSNSIIDLSGQLYEVVNNIMQRLRPDIIDNLDFAETLKNCILKSQLEVAGVTCHLNIEGDINNLNEVVRVTVYRIVQECLTNISKHAMASNVNITIHRKVDRTNLRHNRLYDVTHRNSDYVKDISRDTIAISIADDGVGMEINDNSYSDQQLQRHGLQGINERVTAMGGMLKIASEPGKGVCINAILVLGNSKRDSSRDFTKCNSDLWDMGTDNADYKIINSH